MNAVVNWCTAVCRVECVQSKIDGVDCKCEIQSYAMKYEIKSIEVNIFA